MSTASKCPKAKNPANQRLVECLHTKRLSLPPPQPGRRNHLGFNLKNAEDSIRKSKEPITTYSQAITVKGIGPKIAHILFPDGVEERASKRKQATSSALLDSPSSTGSSSSAAEKRRRQETSENTSALTSAKVRAYERAVADALKWKSQSHHLVWKVVLIVDEREREKTHMESKCLMAKIPCERRTLPIGDMAWIAQAFHRNDRTERPVVELMLGTIIERKSLSDLVQSIKGSRYVEQRMRMKESGLPQLLFLVEGDLHKDSRSTQEYRMCYTAIYETRFHLGFQVVQTANMTETVQTLKRLHRRILKRTFPSAFYAEALPIFSGPSLDHRQQSQQSLSQQSSGSNNSADYLPTVRRRRKNQSLQEMRFDDEPVPFGGMERFITYPEFKAKVEMGRESTSRSIAMIHAAMLKQVPRIETKKIQAIMSTYKTPVSLFRAYDELGSEQAKRDLVAALPIADESSAARRFVGPQSSANLYMAYGMSRDASQQKSYDELAEQVRRGQESVTGSQESQVAMSQDTQATASRIKPAKKSGHTDACVASQQSAARTSAGTADALNEPMGEPKMQVTCIDLLSSDDDMCKKPAARPTRPTASQFDNQTQDQEASTKRQSISHSVGAMKGRATKGMTSLEADDRSTGSSDCSPAKPCVEGQTSVRRNQLYSTMHDSPSNDDDIGSDYEYSPLKASVKKQPTRHTVESAIQSLFPHGQDSSGERPNVQSLLHSSDDEDSDDDDDDVLKSAFTSRCGASAVSSRPTTSKSSTIGHAASIARSKPPHSSKNDVMSVDDSSDDDENAPPLQHANTQSNSASNAAKLPSRTVAPAPEIIDLLDDD